MAHAVENEADHDHCATKTERQAPLDPGSKRRLTIDWRLVEFSLFLIGYRLLLRSFEENALRPILFAEPGFFFRHGRDTAGRDAACAYPIPARGACLIGGQRASRPFLKRK